jgi:alanyl-tRNA synthetase
MAIVSEEAISKGVRRIIAVTGSEAMKVSSIVFEKKKVVVKIFGEKYKSTLNIFKNSLKTFSSVTDLQCCNLLNHLSIV